MNLETLQKAVEKCGSKMVKESEDTFVIDELFEIAKTENPVMVRGIKEHPHSTNKTWLVSKLVYDPGDYVTPPCTDAIEVMELDSLELAVQFTLELIVKNNIENVFTSFWEEEMAKQEEMDSEIYW